MRKIDLTPFDRKRVPPKQNPFFMPFIWAGSWLITRGGKLKIKKERMKGLKPPYLVLGTHQAFMDFCVTPLVLFPHRANYISELEGFENYGEWLYRQVGCLGTRKFVNDLALVSNIRKVMKRKDILVFYPEARYANVGTSSEIPASVGKLAKLLKVPVVVINMHGNYLQSPIWNLTKRKEARLEATITFIDCGYGRLIHKKEGFYLTFKDHGEEEEKTMFFASSTLFSIHTEYNYRGKGQCVTLSTLDNTYFLFSEEKGFNVTKIQFATEYYYKLSKARE